MLLPSSFLNFEFFFFKFCSLLTGITGDVFTLSFDSFVFAAVIAAVAVIIEAAAVVAVAIAVVVAGVALDFMALLDNSFCCFLFAFAFALLALFFDLTVALGEENGVDKVDGVDGVKDFGRDNFGGAFLLGSKSMTNVSQMPRLTMSWTRNSAFGSTYLYELEV